MKSKVMFGLWRHIINVPASFMENQIARVKIRFEAKSDFMTKEHRLVHHWIVRKIPSVGSPLPPEAAVEELGLPGERVNSILDDLEKGMTFLVRNKQGEVVWAYPVTLEQTPHHLTFHNGKQVYAA